MHLCGIVIVSLVILGLIVFASLRGKGGGPSR
jgi:hypothetical protein